MGVLLSHVIGVEDFYIPLLHEILDMRIEDVMLVASEHIGVDTYCGG